MPSCQCIAFLHAHTHASPITHHTSFNSKHDASMDHDVSILTLSVIHGISLASLGNVVDVVWAVTVCLNCCRPPCTRSRPGRLI
mmetsp:Transcript_22619/g.57545  ORF Transcript_22619/g.57545 Transcript_22619/m.57545 type:complete len:84 (+) Transcript_22619:112-363(+)